MSLVPSFHCCTEAGCSGNQQSDTDEPMGTGEEAEHMCVLVYGGFSGDAVEGDLISIDPGTSCSFSHSFDLRFGIIDLAYAGEDVHHAVMPIE